MERAILQGVRKHAFQILMFHKTGKQPLKKSYLEFHGEKSYELPEGRTLLDRSLNADGHMPTAEE